jgi:Na+/proline symporter
MPVIGYVINYYPILNVITAAMQLITLKNNILQALETCFPNIITNLNNSSNSQLKAKSITFLINIFIAGPSIAIALTLNNIQDIMKYFSSIFGFFLMLVLPVMLIYNYRHRMNLTNLPWGKLNRSFIKNTFIPVLAVISVSVLGLIIYGFLNKNSRKCVAEKSKLF